MTTRLLLVLTLALLLAAPATAQSGYEPGVIAVRNDIGRWELVRVPPGTEEAHLVALASAGRETTRLHVLTVEQQDLPPRPLPFDSPIYLPTVTRDYDPHVPIDPLWSQQWDMQMQGVQRQDGNGGAIVAVLDTGWYALDDEPHMVPGWDCVDEDDDPSPIANHGTHVASVLAAPHNDLGIAGACGECRLMIVRVCSYDCAETDIYEGVEYAVAHGTRVINMSLAGSFLMPYLHQAVQDAVEAGVVVVAAAGNQGTASPMCPAAWPEVVAVSSVDADLALAWDSSYGPHIDFAAPGDMVLGGCGSGDNYCYKRGTSMAAPHVAGAFGMLLSEHPGWTSQQAYNWLASHALDLGEPGWDAWYGWGMVRVR